MIELYLLPWITGLIGYLMGYYARALLIKDQKILFKTKGVRYICEGSAHGYINIVAGPVENLAKKLLEESYNGSNY